MLYDCQFLGLREAIVNFVLLKQLAQGTDVECVVLVHCLLVWLLNPGDWQGLPNNSGNGPIERQETPGSSSEAPAMESTEI